MIPRRYEAIAERGECHERRQAYAKRARSRHLVAFLANADRPRQYRGPLGGTRRAVPSGLDGAKPVS